MYAVNSPEFSAERGQVINQTNQIGKQINLSEEKVQEVPGRGQSRAIAAS